MAKYSSTGAIFARSADGGATYTTIAGVGDISGPSMSKDAIDVTSHDSTSKWREFVSGLRDGGEVSVTLIHDPEDITNQGLLRDDFEGDAAGKYQIVYPSANAANLSFDAHVTGLGDALPLEGRIEQEITLKITGSVVHAETD